MKRWMLILSLALALGLLFVTPVLAGGWAVITLDHLPGEVGAGQPVEIGFMVRQHGVTPLDGLSPTITAQLSNSTKFVTATATAEGETGHYVASLTLPESGTWEWSIAAFTGSQPMPALTVVDSVPLAEAPTSPQAGPSLQAVRWAAGVLGIAGTLLGLFFIFQRKARWAIALVLAGLLLGAGSIVSAAAQPAQSAQEEQAAPTNSSISQVELGRDLFIAKGCMLCHSHTATNQIREFGTDMGPDLTHFKASAEYLRLWLKDPVSVKPATKMPTLGLSDSEIEALIAFINDD